MTRTRRDRAEEGDRPDPTWADLRQLGWGLLLVWAIVALFAALARDYFGGRTAIWVGLGFAALVTAAFALITACSLLVWYGARWVGRHRGRRRDAERDR